MADVCMKIDSERRHFMMYWNVEKYDDGTRYVFCDELEDYTFHPYVGSLKEIPGYSKIVQHLRTFAFSLLSMQPTS